MSEPEQTTRRPPQNVSADDALPPVEAPGVGFIMQLFFIPLIIVMIIVMLWLMFSYFAHMGTNPQDLVVEIEKLNDGSWQKASALADLLNNPQNEQLKHDKQLAGRIAALLEREIEQASLDEKRLRLRMFLCLVLGEFRVDTGLPALLKAAETERSVEELEVRRTALEALAALISNLGPENVRGNARLEEVLLEASQERGDGSGGDASRETIRHTAAYALGVLGSQAALDRLAVMLGDSDPNTRYNAATALARNGDPRAQRRLLEMLDPQNQAAFTAEDLRGNDPTGGKRWKRSLVLSNGIKASVLLAARNPDFDDTQLKAAIEQLIEADLKVDNQPLPRQIRLQAQEALSRME
jgi:HEAT repeat protein